MRRHRPAPLAAAVAIAFLFGLSLLTVTAFAQDVPESDIRVEGRVDRTSVPLNRTVEFVVELSWKGTADDFSLVDFTDPSFSNFEIIGTSTSTRTETAGGGTLLFNRYAYTLRPLELGMGYIEGVTVKVRNHAFDREENLATRRIPVEVTAPEADPGERRPSWWEYALIAMILAAAGGLFFRGRARRRRAREEGREVPVPLESRFLDELRREIQLDRPDPQEDFTRLSRLLRRYLAEAFAPEALNVPADRLADVLTDAGFEENRVTALGEIVLRSEEIKFSGAAGTREELNRFYTLFEGLLESRLRSAEPGKNNEKPGK